MDTKETWDRLSLVFIGLAVGSVLGGLMIGAGKPYIALVVITLFLVGFLVSSWKNINEY